MKICSFAGEAALWYVVSTVSTVSTVQFENKFPPLFGWWEYIGLPQMSCNRCNIHCLRVIYSTLSSSHIRKREDRWKLKMFRFHSEILTLALHFILFACEIAAVHFYFYILYLSKTNRYMELAFQIYISRDFYFPFDSIPALYLELSGW